MDRYDQPAHCVSQQLQSCVHSCHRHVCANCVLDMLPLRHRLPRWATAVGSMKDCIPACCAELGQISTSTSKGLLPCPLSVRLIQRASKLGSDS